MGDYAAAARYYDVLYGSEKDYAAEADLLVALIRAASPDARTVLDVGCGTGAHARALIDRGFAVDGVDIEPQFVEIAASKCPEGTFAIGDMRSLEVHARYDAVVSLFSAIGYVKDEDALRATLSGMASHLEPGGVVLVDPWFEPGDMDDRWIATVVGSDADVSVCRMSRTVLDGPVSRLEFEYLIGTGEGIERCSEVHELGLFTEAQMRGAFEGAGLAVQRSAKALRTRGIYIGTPAKST